MLFILFSALSFAAAFPAAKFTYKKFLAGQQKHLRVIVSAAVFAAAFAALFCALSWGYMALFWPA
jgi:hypothetical protein